MAIPEQPMGPPAEDTPQDSQLAMKVEADLAEAQLLSEVTKDFKRLQRQKSRLPGGVESRVITARCFRWGDQHVSGGTTAIRCEPREENKLYLVFNLIDKAADKLIGRLTALGGQFYARPDKQDPSALSEAEVVDKVILALDEKLDQPARTWELVDTLLTDGVAFEYVPWIPNVTNEPVAQFGEQGEVLFKNSTTGEVITEQQRDELAQSGVPMEAFDIYEEVEPVGDVGSEILSALNVFIDQGVRSVEDLAPDQGVYIAKIRTIGWIEENYPEKLGEDAELESDLSIVTTKISQTGDVVSSILLRDLIPMYQGSTDSDDPKMAVVVERFLPNSKKHPHGKFTCFIPGKKILFDGDNPYEDIPIVDFHFKPVTNSFWTKDFISDLIAPQKFINKRISQLGEQSNAAIYDKILMGGQLSAKDIDPDRPSVIEKAFSDTGQPLVSRLAGPELPGWFLNSVETVIKLFSQIAGGSDLFDESQFPGQLRGPMALPMLQELLDSAWGPLYQHIGQRMARVKQMRINRVKQFYPPVRTLHFTDKNQRDEVIQFHKEQVLGNGTNFNITVDRGSLLPEFRALREARVSERLSGPLGVLYTDDRTGMVDKSKVAADLHMGDFGREGKEANSRKFANQLIERLWKAEAIPPVMQFWDHEPMLDELEATMMTTEFLSASPQVQQVFIDRWNQHATFLQQRAQAQQAAQTGAAVQNAVAQATQQAAAMAASDTVNSAQHQVEAQRQADQANPVAGMVRAQGGGLK